MCRSLTESPQHPWRFQQGALFGRLDAFEERCRCMSDAKKAAQQFGALARVEIGGTKVCTSTHHTSYEMEQLDVSACSDLFPV